MEFKSPSDVYCNLWDGDSAPNLEDFAAEYAELTLRELTDLILIDQSRRWGRGDTTSAETYMSRFPQIAATRELKLDVVYGEMRIQAEFGASLDTADYVSRFPDLADELIRQLEIGQWLGTTEVRDGRITLRVFLHGRCLFKTGLEQTTEIGRQRPGDPSPFSEISTENGQRVILAGLEDTHISRVCLRLKVNDDRSVAVTNCASKSSVTIDSQKQLAPGKSFEAPIPMLLSFGDFGIRLDEMT